MRTFWPSIVFIGFIINSVIAQRGSPEILQDGQSVDEMIADFMRDHEVPGMAVAIVQAPYITRVTGFGVSDPERNLLSSSNTLFEIGQMADAYTAVAIMQLVEQGKIALDDSVDDHLSSLPQGWAGISIRRILHQQNLPDGDEGPELLRLLIEKTAGMTYQQFVRTGQFEPLGLKHTFFASGLEQFPTEPHGKFLHDAVYINPTEVAVGRTAENTVADAPNPTAIYATAEDISIWDIGLAGDILIKDPALRKILYQPLAPTGDEIHPSSGPWFFPGHDGLMITVGSSAGFSSLLSRFTNPNELVCVTLLANKEGLDLTQLARRIAGAYDPKLGPPAGTAGMRVQQSPYSVSETIDRLEAALKEMGIGIVARMDHSQAAKSADLNLPPTEEILFGNPANGTLLMQSNRAAAVDLPLSAVAWEENGEVWLAAKDPVEVARRHQIDDRHAETLRMRAGIDAALLKAVQ